MLSKHLLPVLGMATMLLFGRCTLAQIHPIDPPPEPSKPITIKPPVTMPNVNTTANTGANTNLSLAVLEPAPAAAYASGGSSPPRQIKPLTWFAVPCIEDLTSDYCDAVKDATGLIDRVGWLGRPNIDDSDFIDNWIVTTSKHDYVFIYLPAEVDEGVLIRKLVEMQLRAVDIVQAKLESDIRRLTPFPGNNSATAQEAREEAYRHSQWVHRVAQQAREDASRSVSRDDTRSERRLKVSDSNAYHQLLHVHSFGWGGN